MPDAHPSAVRPRAGPPSLAVESHGRRPFRYTRARVGHLYTLERHGSNPPFRVRASPARACVRHRIMAAARTCFAIAADAAGLERALRARTPPTPGLTAPTLALHSSHRPDSDSFRAKCRPCSAAHSQADSPSFRPLHSAPFRPGAPSRPIASASLRCVPAARKLARQPRQLVRSHVFPAREHRLRRSA